MDWTRNCSAPTDPDLDLDPEPDVTTRTRASGEHGFEGFCRTNVTVSVPGPTPTLAMSPAPGPNTSPSASTAKTPHPCLSSGSEMGKKSQEMPPGARVSVSSSDGSVTSDASHTEGPSDRQVRWQCDE